MGVITAANAETRRMKGKIAFHAGRALELILTNVQANKPRVTNASIKQTLSDPQRQLSPPHPPPVLPAQEHLLPQLDAQIATRACSKSQTGPKQNGTQCMLAILLKLGAIHCGPTTCMIAAQKRAMLFRHHAHRVHPHQHQHQHLR